MKKLNKKPQFSHIAAIGLLLLLVIILFVKNRDNHDDVAPNSIELKNIPPTKRSSAASKSNGTQNEKLEKLIGTNSTIAMYEMIENALSGGNPKQFLPSLIKICSQEKEEVVQYTLAQGDSAPSLIRLTLYAAALDNPSEDIRDIASGELKAIVGQDFQSSKSAFTWIDLHKTEFDQ